MKKMETHFSEIQTAASSMSGGIVGSGQLSVG
jgi:hypothetical protein